MAPSFALAAGAKLRLRIHYKKNYRDIHRAVEDRSQIGLYFREILRWPTPPFRRWIWRPTNAERGSERQRLVATVETAMRVLALRPSLDRDYQSIAVDAVLPTGRRPLLRLRSPRADWPRRYWLSEPVDLPPGTRHRSDRHRGATVIDRDATASPSTRFKWRSISSRDNRTGDAFNAMSTDTPCQSAAVTRRSPAAGARDCFWPCRSCFFSSFRLRARTTSSAWSGPTA